MRPVSRPCLGDSRPYPAHPAHDLAEVHRHLPGDLNSELRRGFHLVEPSRARNQCLRQYGNFKSGNDQGGKKGVEGRYDVSCPEQKRPN